jgi:hypothetical protein
LVVTELGMVEKDAEDAILDIGGDGISLRARIRSACCEDTRSQYLIAKFIYNDSELGLCDGFIEVSFAILFVFLDISLESRDETLNVARERVQYLT